MPHFFLFEMNHIFQKNFLFLYFLVLISWGIAYIFFLPPFEGRDESFHYSSVRQLAHTGSIPVLGEARVDQLLQQYGFIGPVPYRNVAPFEPPVSRTYKGFSNDQAAQERYQKLVRDGVDKRPPYVAGNELNVKAQHSVFYYALLAPFAYLTTNWPLYSELIFLRFISFLIALGGVIFAYRACLNFFGDQNISSINLAFLAYPFLFPQFFPEFTRIGNDALALFFFGLTFLFVSQEKKLPHVSRPWRLGIALGLGLLAKAVFIPVALSLLGWLLWTNYRQNKTLSDHLVANFHQIKKVAIGTFIFGGWWYAERWLYFGHQGISFDIMRLNERGGLWVNLLGHFTWSEWLNAIKNLWWSWHWMGGWSMVDLPWFAMMPILLLGALVITSGVHLMFKKGIDSIYGFLALFLCCFIGFILYHMLVAMALLQTTAWSKYGAYLQDFMPAMVFLMTGLLCRYPQYRIRRPLLLGFLILTIFHMVAFWSMLAVFGGCATKGANRQIIFSDYFCVDLIAQVWQINAVISNTGFAITFLIVSLGLAWFLVVQALLAVSPGHAHKKSEC